MVAFSTYFHGAELREQVDGVSLPDGQNTSIIGLVGVSPQGPVNELTLVRNPEEALAVFGHPSVWQDASKLAEARRLVIAGEIKKIDDKIKATRVPDEKAELEKTKEPWNLELAGLTKQMEQITSAMAKENYTLPQAFDSIFVNANTMVIVLNVFDAEIAAGAGDDVTARFLKSVQGIAGRRTGVFKLLDSRDKFDFMPKLILAPEFSHDPAVRLGMEKVAADGGGVAIIDIEETKTVDQAVEEGRSLTSSRFYPTYPRVKPIIGSDGGRSLPYSSFVAGLIALTDQQEGYGRSPSNKLIKGIAGLSKTVTFSMNDANCDANRLNEVGIATLIRFNGFRHWGSRTAGKNDPLETANMFLPVRRTRDKLNEVVLSIAFEAIDRKIGLNFIEFVETSVNEYIRLEKQTGNLLGGECRALPKDNPSSQLKKGTVVFTVDSGATPPAEQIKIISVVTDKYLEALFNG